MDRRLHAGRIADRRQRWHEMPWRDVPSDAFAVVDDSPALVLEDRLVPWSAAAYGPALEPSDLRRRDGLNASLER